MEFQAFQESNVRYSPSTRRNEETTNQVDSLSFQHYPVQVLAQNIHLSERRTATTQTTVCTSLTAAVCQILLLNKHQQIPLTISLSSDLSLDITAVPNILFIYYSGRIVGQMVYSYSAE